MNVRPSRLRQAVFDRVGRSHPFYDMRVLHLPDELEVEASAVNPQTGQIRVDVGGAWVPIPTSPPDRAGEAKSPNVQGAATVMNAEGDGKERAPCVAGTAMVTDLIERSGACCF